MPRITVDNTEIVVSFQHGYKPNTYQGRKPRTMKPYESEYTQCVVLFGEKGLRDEEKTKTTAVVSRHHGDTPNRVKARRAALELAINKTNLSTVQREAAFSVIRSA